jgi:HPt (histidine-containing phosphotransfer) domain-containing protein
MEELFDKQALLEGVDGDTEFLEETIAMLDEDSVELLDQVRAAAAAGDAAALVKPAHAIKGMVGNFCAARAEAAAREVELIGREGRMEGVTEAIQTLCREVEQLRTALHAFLKDQQE